MYGLKSFSRIFHSLVTCGVALGLNFNNICGSLCEFDQWSQYSWFPFHSDSRKCMFAGYRAVDQAAFPLWLWELQVWGGHLQAASQQRHSEYWKCIQPELQRIILHVSPGIPWSWGWGPGWDAAMLHLWGLVSWVSSWTSANTSGESYLNDFEGSMFVAQFSCIYRRIDQLKTKENKLGLLWLCEGILCTVSDQFMCCSPLDGNQQCPNIRYGSRMFKNLLDVLLKLHMECEMKRLGSAYLQLARVYTICKFVWCCFGHIWWHTPTLQNSKAEIIMLQVPRDEEGEPTFDELICPACVPKCSFVSKYQRYVVAPMSAPTTGIDPVVNEGVNISGMRICSTLTSTSQLGTFSWPMNVFVNA